MLKNDTHTHATDWVYPSLVNGTTDDSAFGGGRVRYRREGNHVYIAGGLSAITYTGSSVTIFTLPEGLRPAHENHYFLKACSGERVARVYVDDSTGNVTLEWVKNISNGSSYTSSVWLDMNMDFWTD